MAPFIDFLDKSARVYYVESTLSPNFSIKVEKNIENVVCSLSFNLRGQIQSYELKNYLIFLVSSEQLSLRMTVFLTVFWNLLVDFFFLL